MSKVFLPISFVHRDKTYYPVVDKEEPVDNNCLGALPNSPQDSGTKTAQPQSITKTERDTKSSQPQHVTKKEKAHSRHDYESLDIIMYVTHCFKCSHLAEIVVKKCVCVCACAC